MSADLERFVIFGFDSTHDALRAETALLDAVIEVALIPTPRALGTLCGFAVRVPAGQRDAAIEALAAVGVRPNGEIEMDDRVGR